VLLPLNAAALPEIMAGDVEEGKRRMLPEPYPDGQAAGQQQGSTAGARGCGTAEAKPRPNVEVNRRAEGTSGLNRRLGDGAKGAAALDCCGVAGDYGRGLAGRKARCAWRWTDREQQASDQEAQPEFEGVERRHPAKD